MERTSEHLSTEREYAELDRKFSVALKEAHAGNSDLLGHMLNDMRPFLIRVVANRSTDQGHTDEMIQEAFCRFVANLDDFKDKGFKNLERYLAKSVKNNLINYFRIRQVHIPLDRVEGVLYLEPFEGIVDDMLDARKIIDIELPRMGKRQQRVFLLTIDGFTPEEIAEQLGCTSNVVRINKHRALGRMRQLVS